MAIIKSFAPFQNLTNFQVFENDTLSTSEYFRITELSETLTGGKNGFLIEGSEFLKETTEVKIEILDVEGNPIYFEPGKGAPDYYEGNSTLVSVHVYDDTPIGIGKITILGELKSVLGEENAVVDIPQEWKGVYNVKWERQIQINKNIANETIVRFYKRPLVTISEIVKPVFSKTINDTTDTGSVNGFPLQPPLGQNLSEWRAGTNYLLQRTSGSWDSDVDENVINITITKDGNGDVYNNETGSIYTASQFPNQTPATQSVLSATIIEVLNDTDVIIDIPYVSSSLVQNISDEAFSVSYQDIENETTSETAITGSFAKIDITQLKTFVGDVARVKIFRKSRNAVGDFQFVQEAKLESQELLRDVTTTTDTEVFYGRLSTDNLSTYWETSNSDHPITVDSSQLFRAAKIDYNNDSGSVQQLITSQSINVSKDVEYTLEFKTLLSGSIDDSNKSIRAFFSASNFTQDFLTVSGSAIYQSRQDISQNIILQNSGSAKLVFEVQGDDWYISNISLRNAQDTSFSPDEFTIIQDIPRKTATETFDFRFEFYDINNNFIPVEVKATKEFDGGNDFPTSGKLFTFESDRNAFRFSSGSIGNPPFQQIQFKTSQQNLTGTTTYASAAFDEDGNYIDPSSYGGDYPGGLTSITPAGSIITIANFSGSEDDVVVGSIIYTASLDGLEEFETVYRLEDGDNAPQLIVTSNANQFIYEPTTLSPKPSGQSITVRAQRKNLASLVTPITVNSGSNKPALTFVDTVNGIDTYTISATQFSSNSFESNSFEEVTYEFTGSDIFGNEQTDEITLSKVINFDAVSIVLTNESTSFPAKSTGEILGDLIPSSGSVQMFIGGNQIEHDDEIGDRTKNTFNITSSIGDNVTPTDTTPNTSNYSISAFETTKDSGSLTLTIDYLAGDGITSQSFQKIVSYTKSKKAVPTVLTKVSPSTQTINSSSALFETPQTMEVIVQEGGDEYSYDSSLTGGGDINARKFVIDSLSVNVGSASFDDNIITLFTTSTVDDIPEFTDVTNGLTGSAFLNYVNSEGTYVTGSRVRFDLSVSKIGVDGVNGASGSNARAVSLSSDKYAIVYDGDGNLHPSNQNFTLNGSAQNFNTPEFQFLSGGAVIHDFATTSEVVISSSGYPSAGTSIIYEVRTREQGGSYEGVFDNIDVFAVQSGSDAFTVFLTNEAHVFSATSESVVTSDLSDGAFEVRFFRGGEQYNSGSTGKTYSVSATTSNIILSESLESNNQAKFTPTSISGDSGSASITITDNNTSKTFDKQYSFTLSKEGIAGQDGQDGSAGEDFKAVKLTSANYIISYNAAGSSPSPSGTITLTATSQNFTNAFFKFTGEGITDETSYTDGSGANSDTFDFSVPSSYFSTPKDIRVGVAEGNQSELAFDTITITAVQPGSDGQDGDPGDAGADAYTVIVTNEAHTLPTTNTGTVTYTGSGTSIIVYKGATELNSVTSTPTSGQFKVTATATNITAGSQTVTGNPSVFANASSITSTTAQISFAINIENQVTITKIQTFSKSIQGDDGEDGEDGQDGQDGGTGPQGDAGLRTAQGMVHYNTTSATAPSSPNDGTTSFNFSTGVMSGMRSGWQMGTPTYEAGNSNKYWYATFTSVENSSGAGVGTNSNNSFGTVTQAINFTGLVSFTATDTIGDGTDNLSFGVAGSTLINGDNISTGRIISTNYVTGSGDGFTNTGTEFSLDEGLLASKNFTIKPNGSAFFKGDLTGASGTFSGTVQVGGTTLTTGNTLNSNTTKDDVNLGNVDNQSAATIQAGTTAANVGLGNVQDLNAQNQAQTGLIAGTTITGGGITLNAGGNIKGGQTAFNTGTGFFLGYSSGYKFSIGDGSTKGITWDGSTLTIGGNAQIGVDSISTIQSNANSALQSGDNISVLTNNSGYQNNSAAKTAGSVGGWTIDSNAIYRGTELADNTYGTSTGQITLGAGFIGAKEFKISAAGVASFKGGVENGATLGNWSVSGGDLVDSTGVIQLDPNDKAIRLKETDGTVRVTLSSADLANISPTRDIDASNAALNEELIFNSNSTYSGLNTSFNGGSSLSYSQLTIGTSAKTYGATNKELNEATSSAYTHGGGGLPIIIPIGSSDRSSNNHTGRIEINAPTASPSYYLYFDEAEMTSTLKLKYEVLLKNTGGSSAGAFSPTGSAVTIDVASINTTGGDELVVRKGDFVSIGQPAGANYQAIKYWEDYGFEWNDFTIETTVADAAAGDYKVRLTWFIDYELSVKATQTVNPLTYPGPYMQVEVDVFVQDLSNTPVTFGTFNQEVAVGLNGVQVSGVSGSVLIGEVNDSGVMSVYGNALVTGKLTANTTALSDERLKSNIQDIPNPLDIIDSIQPRSFKWRNNVNPDEFRENSFGFIAQEMTGSLPQFVSVEHQPIGYIENILTIDQTPLIALNTAGIKELVTKISSLETKIEQLEAQISGSE
jgi:hypothetical protein